MKNFIIAIAIVVAFVIVWGIIATSIPPEDLFEGRSRTVEYRTGMEVIGGHDNNFIIMDSQGICYLYIMGGSPSSSQMVPCYNSDGTVMTREQYLSNQDVK